MEKQKQNQISESKSWPPYGNSSLWDCGSTLYDSFELNSFKRQLDSAITNSHRTLSMSNVPERRLSLQPQQPASSVSSKKPFKIPRYFQKFIRSVFKSGNKSTISSSTTTTASFLVPDKYNKERFYVVFDKSGPVLSTIPEVPEFEIGALSPEISSLVRRSASERFTATTISIACT